MRRNRAWVTILALALTILVGCVDKPMEHRVRANAYLRAGEASKALAECQQGLKVSPKDVPLLILSGKALFELEQRKEARDSYRAALEAGSALPPAQLNEAYLGLAMIAARDEDWAAARKHFTTLVEVDGKNADARVNLARACLQLKDLKCAVKQAEEAGHLRGGSENVLFTLGRIYLVAKQLDNAEGTFKHICERVPNAASCPYGLALVALARGDKPLALTKLKEAIARKTPQPRQARRRPLAGTAEGRPRLPAASRLRDSRLAACLYARRLFGGSLRVCVCCLTRKRAGLAATEPWRRASADSPALCAVGGRRPPPCAPWRAVDR